MTATGTVLRHRMKKERPAPAVRTVTRRNVAGHDLGQVELEPTVFGLEPNRAVLHQVVTAQLAAARAGTHSTRTRAEVRGGGAKPYRQKGTGRSRQGTTRAPSMNGGGVAAGPKPRSYEQRTPKKMVRLALLSALSDRADTRRISLIDDWEITEPDTKSAVTILRKLRLKGSVLVVLADDETDVALSFRNLREARITTHAELSAHDVIRADWVLFSDRSLPTAVSDFSGTHKRDKREKREKRAAAADDTTAAAAAGTNEKEPAPEATQAEPVEPVEDAEEAETEESHDDA